MGLDLTNLHDLRSALGLAGISPDTARDQHFLVDRESLDAIVTVADLSPDDTVLEIGTGVGTLTAELTSRVGRVVAVELDKDLAEIVERAKYPNLELHQQDFRYFDLSILPSDYKVVANLPYGITSLVLQKILDTDHRPRSMTLLVQKEVAERICTEPGQMSILALSVQYYGSPHIIRQVPAESFYPAPRVDSAVLHIEVFDQPVVDVAAKDLFRLIKIGFSARRKMLKNNLVGGMQLTPEQVETVFAEANIAATARAQELSLQDWARLHQALK